MWWLFKRDVKRPEMPLFPRMNPEDVPAASALLYYNGNWLTELVGRKKGNFPYERPPFHAAILIDHLQVVNVGWTTSIIPLARQMISTRRIDAIIYPDLTPAQREAICVSARQKCGRGIYDWRGFLSQGISFINPAPRQDYCSQQVTTVFQKENQIPVSIKTDEKSAPWDLFFGAKYGPTKTEIRTLWVGPDAGY